jgi:transcriptional regulator with XRE-family HTH domain
VDAATLLTRCRVRAGLTQRELARRAGTSAAAVCLYEQGERVPRIDTLTRLVAATGSTLELDAVPGPAVDVAANARTLEELLDLTDHLPQRSARRLGVPPFAALAQRAPRAP